MKPETRSPVQGICRTVDEIRMAGRAAARDMPGLTESEARKVIALLAPYRDRLVTQVFVA